MKKYNSKIHNRRSVRLREYDYAQEGMYFITVCTEKLIHQFGEITNEKMINNELGNMLEHFWYKIPVYFPHVEMDKFVVMPNHFHGIIHIVDEEGYPLPLKNGTSQTIGSMVRCFKSEVTKWAKKNMQLEKIWQRNYYEHIIRNEKDYYRIWEYIDNNPIKWELDELNIFP